MTEVDLVARTILAAVFERLNQFASASKDINAKLALRDAADEMLQSALEIDKRYSREIGARLEAATAAAMTSSGDTPPPVLH